jgi:hypothetical protein
MEGRMIMEASKWKQSLGLSGVLLLLVFVAWIYKPG